MTWAGYNLAWCQAVQLSEVLPHSRNRLLLIAVRRDDARVAQIAPAMWVPKPERPRLAEVLLPQGHESHQYAPGLDAETFSQYFRLPLLPRQTGTSQHEVRRCRVRTYDDIHPCIMANYGYAHELPEQVLRTGGLLGSFVLCQGQIRWLSPVEITILFGCPSRCHIPCDPHITNHMMGNAIAVPHAVLCLLNGLAQLAHIRWNEVPLWMLDEILGSRITRQSA